MNSSKYESKIMKRCPICGWRIFDKITPTTGFIEMKCPGCRRVITVDLSRRLVKRRSNSYQIA